MRISTLPVARLALLAARIGASALCKSRSRSATAIFSAIVRLEDFVGGSVSNVLLLLVVISVLEPDPLIRQPVSSNDVL